MGSQFCSKGSSIALMVASVVGLSACNESSFGLISGDEASQFQMDGEGYDSQGPGNGGGNGSGAPAVTPKNDGGRDAELCDNPNEVQVKICHVPSGNPAARHTLCVGYKGAIRGHGVDFENGLPGGHGGDYPGECVDQPQ